MTHKNEIGSSTPALPFPRSYCVVPGLLLAGCYPGDLDPTEAQAKLEGLVQCNVGLVINLTEVGETNWNGVQFVDYCPMLNGLAQKVGRSISCERLSIRDNDVPASEQMRLILDRIDEPNAAKQVVYVHCWGGKGRTAMVVGCYLARHGIAVGEGALVRLNELVKASAFNFGYVPQTKAQCEFVRNWKQAQ